MTIAEQFFPGDGSYLLIGTNETFHARQITIERVSPEFFLLNYLGRCLCVSEAWIERVGIDGLDRKAFAWRRYIQRCRRYARKVCWADKPGAFAGDARKGGD